MPSELEGLIFPYFFAENRILGCLGGILEASWAVLAKFLSRLGPQLGSNLDPKMALELPKGRPKGAYRSPKRPLGAKNRSIAAQNLPKPPQGGAQTHFQASILEHSGKDFIKKFNRSSEFLKARF